MTSPSLRLFSFRARDHSKIRDTMKGRKSMRNARTRLLAAAFFLAPAFAARAEDTCLVKATFGGKTVTLKHCAMAVYDEKGATLFFNESPISAEEAAAFSWNSYPKDKDASGK